MIKELPPPITQQLELKKTLLPRGSTKSAPERRKSKQKLIQVEESDEEEGTSKHEPQTHPMEEITEMFKEQVGKVGVPFSDKCKAMEQARDYNKLKAIQKECAKQDKEEEAEEEEEEIKKWNLVHRDKRTKPKGDPHTVQMREEHLWELKEQTKQEVSLTKNSKEIIREMMKKKGKEARRSKTFRDGQEIGYSNQEG